MGVLTVQKEVKNAVVHSMVQNSSSALGASTVVGGDITVSAECRLRGLGFTRAVTTGNAYPVGVYNASSGALLASSTVVAQNVAALFAQALTLKPGFTYRVGILLPSGQYTSNSRVPAAPAYPLSLGHGWTKASATLTFPNSTDQGTSWTGDFVFDLEYSTSDIKTEPPEPEIAASGKQFIITLPADWIPANLKEWDLQYQKALDNVSFADWLDIGTFDGAAEHVYTHISLDTVAPLPFYRYRYRLRTQTQQSNWSEAAFAGQVRNEVNPTTDFTEPVSELAPGTVGNLELGPDAVEDINVKNLNAAKLIAGTITSEKLYSGLVEADRIQANNIAANTITSTHIQSGSITAGKIHAGAIDADDIIANGMIKAGMLQAGTINTANIIVSGLINNTHIDNGVINGVKLTDGTVDAKKVVANSITSAQVATDFLDANIAKSAYLFGDQIRGGNILLGGTRNYTAFKASSGALMYPWSLVSNVTSNIATYNNLAPATKKYTAAWDSNILRVDFENGASLSNGEQVAFQVDTTSANRFKGVNFHIKLNIPANTIFEIIDSSSNVIYSKTGASTYETSAAGTLDLETLSLSTLSSLLKFQVRTTGGFTAGSGLFWQITKVELQYERGSGALQVYDNQNQLRSEMTSDYISFNKVSSYSGYTRSPTSNTTFLADKDGVWVPADGLTIGSSKVTNLTYNQRDLTGGLIVNPRFESTNIRVTSGTNTTILPSDWTYIQTLTEFGTEDGLLPQWQGLVAGKTLTMNLPNGSTSSTKRQAVSHKKYMAISPSEGLPKIPFSMAAHWLATTATSEESYKVRTKLSLYSSSSSADVVAVPDAGDTLLGSVTMDGVSQTAWETTIDGNKQFKKIYLDYLSAPVGNMILDSSRYVYMVLEASVASSLAYSAQILKNSPLVYLRLGEPSGTNAADSSGNNKYGTYRGSPTLGGTGALSGDSDKCVSLNGTSQYVEGVAGYNPFTVGANMTFEAWVYRNNTTNGDAIMGGSVGSGGTMLMRLQSGADTLNFYPQASTAASWTSCGVGTGAWHHVVVTFDNVNNSATLYVDGVSKGAQTASDDFSATAQTYMVGAWNQVVTVKDYFDGKIDEVAIYSGLLSANEIKNHYQIGAAAIALNDVAKVKWDNVDLTASERLTPSDNQAMADLARRITEHQTLFTYSLSGTKAVLPELDNSIGTSGVQGLLFTVQN